MEQIHLTGALETFEKDAIATFQNHLDIVTSLFHLCGYIFITTPNGIEITDEITKQKDILEISQLRQRGKTSNIFETKNLSLAYKYEASSFQNAMITHTNHKFEFTKGNSEIFVNLAIYTNEKKLYINILNSSNSYKKIYFSLTSYGMKITLSNMHGQRGTYRQFEYNDIDKLQSGFHDTTYVENLEKDDQDSISLSLVGDVHGDYYIITKEQFDGIVSPEIRRKKASREYGRYYSRQILSSDRVRTLFVYTINTIKDDLPNIIPYISEEFPFFLELCNIISEQGNRDDDIHEYLESNTLASCNLPNEASKRPFREQWID